MAKGRLGEMKIDQWTLFDFQKREKNRTLKKNEESLHEHWDIINRSPEKRQDQNIFEESMTKNFLNLMKAINYLTKVQKRYLERKLLLDIKL